MHALRIYTCIYILNAELMLIICILYSSLYIILPAYYVSKHYYFFLSVYKSLPISWIILHVLSRYECESDKMVKDEKTLESIVIIFSMYGNTFIWFKWNFKKKYNW